MNSLASRPNLRPRIPRSGPKHRFQNAVAFLMLFAGLPEPAAVGHTWGEFWIAQRRDDATGTGTREDPLNGGTAVRFGAALRSIPERSVIHLLPGTYETHGFSHAVGESFVVKNGWRIRGAGPGTTIVRLIHAPSDGSNSSGWNCVFFNGWGPGVSEVSISDLTVDCNYDGVSKSTGLTNLTLNAVFLTGNDLRVERVKVTGASGLRYRFPNSSPEAFIITISPRNEKTEAKGYVIRDCEVTEFAGGTCTAISITGPGGKSGSTGLIENNRVQLQGKGGQFAYSAYGSGGIVVQNNLAIQTSRAFNWDTGQGRNLIIRNNLFLECTGAAVLLGGCRESILENNLIELTGTNSTAILMSAPNEIFPGASDWIIRGNTVRNASAGRNYFIQCWGNVAPGGVILEENRIDSSLRTAELGRGFAAVRNNTDLAGRGYFLPTYPLK